MKCPVCGSESINGLCPKCGLAHETLRKAGTVSDFLYNRGLLAAKNNDMTNAIGFLTKSVEFDKTNKYSLNLLGLCYYNIGKINDALKMWVICFNYYGTDTHAARYLKTAEQSPKKLEQMQESITLYNAARSYAQQGSEDLAIVRLKKVLDFNPDFTDALNLLALCHMRAKDRTKALACVERTLNVDAGNVAALSYFKEFSTGAVSGRASKIVTPDTYKAAYTERYPSKTTDRDEVHKRTLADRLRISEFILFLIGVAIAAGFMYFLAFPALQEAERERTAAAEQVLRDEIAALEHAAATTVIDDDTVLAHVARLEAELNDERALLAAAQNRVIIYRANYYLLNGQPVDAANYLDTIIGEVPPDMLWLHDSIVNATYPALETQYFNAGRESFNAGNHAEARFRFERSERFATAQSTTIPNTLLYLARIAVAENDGDNARLLFERIAELYPATAAANEARAWLDSNSD